MTLKPTNGRIPNMDAREFALRDIKDRVAAALGSIDDAAPEPGRKENFRRLTRAASELHRCADEIQSILMRVKTR